jgi:phosphoenolpyruvate carboxykinase (ATP)
MRRHKVAGWLVNTGWSGGPYGTGERISLRHTRAMLHAALEGKLADVPFQRHAEFGLMIPTACPRVPSGILDPQSTWADPNAYSSAARKVAKLFEDNFAVYSPHVGDEVRSAGIHATA